MRPRPLRGAASEGAAKEGGPYFGFSDGKEASSHTTAPRTNAAVSISIHVHNDKVVPDGG